MSNRLGRLAGALGVALALGVATPQASQAQQIKAVRITMMTTAGTTTIRNLDVAAALPFDKIKRYSVSLSPMVGIPAGVDRVRLVSGILNATNTSAVDIPVLDVDASTLSRGRVVAPYTGTNSFIRVQRGADGLGPIEVRLNAYVEVEP
jgi:hypothetical protein